MPRLLILTNIGVINDAELTGLSLILSQGHKKSQQWRIWPKILTLQTDYIKQYPADTINFLRLDLIVKAANSGATLAAYFDRVGNSQPDIRNPKLPRVTTE